MRTKRLQLARLTPKQTQIMGELIVYFYQRYERALKLKAKRPDYVEPIPLQKIYERFSCNSKDKVAVKIAANIFFNQLTRGNYKAGTCSKWAVHEKPKVNSLVSRIIRELLKLNNEHIKEVTRFYCSPKGVIVDTKTEFKFKNEAHAEMFMKLMTEIEIQDAFTDQGHEDRTERIRETLILRYEVKNFNAADLA